jgi:hypothetical protein
LYSARENKCACFPDNPVILPMYQPYAGKTAFFSANIFYLPDNRLYEKVPQKQDGIVMKGERGKS